MKIKVIALFLALLALVISVAGCSKEGASSPQTVVNNQPTTKPNTDWIGGKPIPEGEITLVAYILSGSDVSGSTELTPDIELPEVLDTSYNEADYYNYSVRYKLENDQMLQTAIKKRLDPIYKSIDDSYSFLLPTEGVTPFKYDEDTWGVIRDVTVRCGFQKESIKMVILGLDASEASAAE